MKSLVFLLLFFFASYTFADVRIELHQGDARIHIDGHQYVVRPGTLNVNWISGIQLKSKYHTNTGFIYYFSCQTNSGEIFFELVAETGVISLGTQHYERSNAVYLFGLPKVFMPGRSRW